MVVMGRFFLLLLFLAFNHVQGQSNNMLTIRVRYPLESGHQLTIRGSGAGLSWSTGQAVTAVDDTHFEVQLAVDAAEVGQQLAFKILVDDTDWQIGYNEMVELPPDSAAVTVYPFFYSSEGSYKVLPQLYSPVLKNWRHPVIYVPPSYDENPFKPMTNVLVMHDGQNLFNDSTSFMVAWHCQDTINQLVVEGAMAEVAILGLYNTPDRLDEYTYSYDPSQQGGGKGDEYLDFIEQVAIPSVVSQYPRFSTSPSSLGILGSSLGGLISCYAGWTRSHVYGKAGCMSSSFWWNSQDFVNVTMVKFPPPSVESFYLDSGDAGPGKDDEFETLAVRALMESDGWQLNSNLFYYLDKGGEHNEIYWGRRFHIPMTDLYPPQPLTWE